jgi:uncharacterized protein
VFEADAVTADIVGVWTGEDRADALPAEIRDRYPANAVRTALRALCRWRKRGYLAVRRPKRFAFPLAKEQVRGRLDRNVEQLILGVTDECNLRCRYCIYSGAYPLFRVHRPRRMSIQTAWAAIDFYLAHSSGQDELLLSFYGGEPLLCLPLLRSAVAHIEAGRGTRRIRYNVNTNGMALNDSATDFLVEHDFALRVSLDGPEALHDANRVDRSGHGSFRRILGRLKRLKERHPHFFRTRVSFLSVIGWPYDIAGARRFFEREATACGARVEVNAVRPHGTTYFATYPVPKDYHGYRDMEDAYASEMIKKGQAEPFLAGLFDRTMARIASRPLDEPLEEVAYPNGMCMPGVRRLFVDAAGRFQPCERFNETVTIGDVDSGYDEKAIDRLIRQYVATCRSACGGCWARRLCTACPVSANGDGIDLQRKAAFCTLERRSLRRSLSLYLRILEENPGAMDRLLKAEEA